MYSKFTQLSFVIGLFFTLVSFILFGNALSNAPDQKISIYSAVIFLLFGIFMMLIKNTDSAKD